MEAQILDIGSRYRRVDSANASLTFSAGNVVSAELPRSLLYRYIHCRFTGSINFSVAPGSVLNEGANLLISKLELIADGRKVLWSADGPALFRLSHLFRGKAGSFVNITASTGAQSFESSFVIDIHAQRMLSSIDSYFDPRLYEKVELRMTCAAGTAIATGGTLSSVSGTLDVMLMQTAVGANQILFNKIVVQDELSVPGATTSLVQRVPRIGLLAGILIRSANSSNSSVDSIINNLTLKSDSNFLHVDRVPWAGVQRRNAIEYQIDIIGAAASGGGIMPPGWAYLDLTEDGMIPSALNALDLNTLDMIFDCAAAGTIRLTYVFFEPITIGS